MFQNINISDIGERVVRALSLSLSYIVMILVCTFPLWLLFGVGIPLTVFGLMGTPAIFVLGLFVSPDRIEGYLKELKDYYSHQ